MIKVESPQVGEFDPTEAVHFWNRSAKRHCTTSVSSVPPAKRQCTTTSDTISVRQFESDSDSDLEVSDGSDSEVD